jgi:hypothetical protein
MKSETKEITISFFFFFFFFFVFFSVYSIVCITAVMCLLGPIIPLFLEKVKDILLLLRSFALYMVFQKYHGDQVRSKNCISVPCPQEPYRDICFAVFSFFWRRGVHSRLHIYPLCGIFCPAIGTQMEKASPQQVYIPPCVGSFALP